VVLVPQVGALLAWHVSAAGSCRPGELLSALSACRQFESTLRKRKPMIEADICDAPEDPPKTIPVVRPSRLTGGFRPIAVVGTFQVERPVHSVNGRSPIASKFLRRLKAVISGWQLHLRLAPRRKYPRMRWYFNRPKKFSNVKF
jgi:hypothetical protein